MIQAGGLPFAISPRRSLASASKDNQPACEGTARQGYVKPLVSSEILGCVISCIVCCGSPEITCISEHAPGSKLMTALVPGSTSSSERRHGFIPRNRRSGVASWATPARNSDGMSQVHEPSPSGYSLGRTDGCDNLTLKPVRRNSRRSPLHGHRLITCDGSANEYSRAAHRKARQGRVAVLFIPVLTTGN